MKIKDTFNKITAWLRRDKRQTVLFLFVLLITIIGTVILITSRAAAPAVVVEPESGTINSPAVKVTDSTVNGGAAVQFNAQVGGPSGNTWGDHMGISLWPDRTNFDKAKALGVKWVKISWEQNWGTFDYSLIDYAHSIGLKVLQDCQKGDHTYTLADLGSFVSYCAAWVDRGVDAIEIGNEWNHIPFWLPAPDSTYALPAAFFDYTAEAIRQKSATIPIMNSGWSSETSPNLPQEAMAKSLDRSNGKFKVNGSAIAHHPYAYNCDSPLKCDYPARKDWNAFLATQDVYNEAKIRGFDKPIWFTELGGPSGGGFNLYNGQAFTTASQAQLYKDYIAGMALMRAGGVPISIVFWHTTQDGQSFTNDLEKTFGLYDSNWNIKPAGQVVKDQAAKTW